MLPPPPPHSLPADSFAMSYGTRTEPLARAVYRQLTGLTQQDDMREECPMWTYRVGGAALAGTAEPAQPTLSTSSSSSSGGSSGSSGTNSGKPPAALEAQDAFAWLAGSPDGVIAHGLPGGPVGRGILEVKCPQVRAVPPAVPQYLAGTTLPTDSATGSSSDQESILAALIQGSSDSSGSSVSSSPGGGGPFEGDAAMAAAAAAGLPGAAKLWYHMFQVQVRAHMLPPCAGHQPHERLAAAS